MTTCAHCGEKLQGHATVGEATVCHPGNPSLFPDCYRRISLYGEPLSVLRDVRPLPCGVIGVPAMAEWRQIVRLSNLPVD